jgi:large conductance mechanosensitive channel
LVPSTLGVIAGTAQGGLMKGFKTFLLRGNLVDLAVAVVIGVAFNAVVQSLVNDMITPLISAIGGKPNFSALSVHVGKGVFAYGLFLNALISFLLIATVVYFLIVAPMAKMLAIMNRNKAATEQTCPECLSQIPVGATRCKFCTAAIPPAEAPAPAAAS